MDLYHLKTFFVLAKEKNFTQAARRLFVTQSAVSHAIKKLESSIDTPLFIRQGKTMDLTPAGHILFRSCEKIFYEIEKSDQEISTYRKKALVTIRIGSTVEFGASILINHIKPFLDTHPEIHLDFYLSADLEIPLLRDEVDLIIDCVAHELPSIERIYLFQEQYVTIAAPDFLERHQISGIDDLAQVNILSSDKHLAWWRNFITAIPEDKRSCFKNVVQINHIRGIINAAMSGLGIGFVPKYTVIRELEEKSLVDPFPQIQPNADHFNIFIKKEKLEFIKNKALINYLTQIKPSEFGVG
ncbi:LysR family transcriptional regulator [uncultured Desulfobacter sp.]|uniref:LysR family transcriptional regulator n=1 Tax=uncultured Desulfobacter sp. TaxID=240139 RepID=UPI002AA780C4|nr:LysR family transcriptional regulator [uncultured Desulfobacter sp.]